MQGDNIVQPLIRQRRSLGREIARHQAEIERLRLDMAAVDHVLLLWRPEIDLSALVAFAADNGGVKPGDFARPILAALRMATEPMPVIDIARYVAVVRGEVKEPMPIYRKRVRKALDRLRARGLVASVTDGQRLLWQIVR